MFNNFSVVYDTDLLVNGTSSYQPPTVGDVMTSLLQELTPAITIFAIGFAVFVVLFIWSFIRKFNVQEATFRIDKNLQKLVDNIDDQSYIDFQKASKATGKTDVKLPTDNNERVETVL